MRGQGAPRPCGTWPCSRSLYAFTLWLIASTAVTVARRDWILVSLVLSGLLMGAMLTQTRASGRGRVSRWDL